MKLEEYISLLEEHLSALESDAEDVENAASELQEILDGIQEADGLDELKKAIELLEDLNFDPSDLIIPDHSALDKGFDTDSWIDDFKNSVSICEPKKEEPSTEEESKK